jgi:hypothetical protein
MTVLYLEYLKLLQIVGCIYLVSGNSVKAICAPLFQNLKLIVDFYKQLNKPILHHRNLPRIQKACNKFKALYLRYTKKGLIINDLVHDYM